ncbi:hypothetical protein HY501_00365 [Candidatus Woesearchaeota archaeon]|nr:hypothetical protein [Candidatus Woesearchaeota archaeon]
MVGVVGFHEFGHAFTASFLGCEGQRAVIYEKGAVPHTEVICGSLLKKGFIVFGGILFPILISLLFFLTSEVLLREVSYLMLGYSVLFSYGDLQLYVPLFVNIFLSVLALLVITVSVIRLAILRLSQLDR